MFTQYVKTSTHSYPIFIGAGLLKDKTCFQAAISGRQVFVVTNSVIAPLYLSTLQDTLKDYECRVCILPEGEKYKSLDTFSMIVDEMLAQKQGRQTTLIALGGGVIGDLTGFVAACYLRGVSYIQVPTTLLAQVDAAIGGKTAVNHRLLKNAVGAFHFPRAVISDLEVLMTLPDREWREGFAEVLKYGLIADPDFFIWLEEHWHALLNRDRAVLVEAVQNSARIKGSIVSQDEKETGIRAILNLGHTFGHAIESALGYGVWLHGEAVGIGMLMALELSERLQNLSPDLRRRVQSLLNSAQLPTQLPMGVTPGALIELMSRDKKNKNGHLRFILLEKLGQANVTNGVEEHVLEEVIQHYVS